MSRGSDEVEQAKTSERDNGWPEGVIPVSWDNIGSLGVHQDSQKLYWDGKEIVTRSIVSLRAMEAWFAGVASFSALGIFILELVRAVGWLD